jgi:centromere protein C
VRGRPDGHSGTVLVPPIREVIRIPEEPAITRGKRKRQTFRTRNKRRGFEPKEDTILPDLSIRTREEGCDDHKMINCVVLDNRGLEVDRRTFSIYDPS